jgi:hypothetical protein
MSATSSFVPKSSLKTGNFFYAIYNNIGYLNKYVSIVSLRVAKQSPRNSE